MVNHNGAERGKQFYPDSKSGDVSPATYPAFESLEPRVLLDGNSPSLFLPNHSAEGNGDSIGPVCYASFVAGASSQSGTGNPGTLAASGAIPSTVDLVGRIGRVTLPGAVVTGQPMRGNVQVQVLNVGTVALGPQARVNVDVFASNTATGEQISLGQLTNRSVAKLAPNGARASAFTVAVNLPAGLPKGDYEIQALITPVSGVDETNLTNNLAAGLADGQAVGLTAADPFIDLVAGVNDKLAAKYPLPANAVSGDGKQLFVPITITNMGNVSTARTQRIDVNLYARNSAGQNILIGILENQNVGNLGPGKTKQFLFKTTLPAGLASDQYTIVAEIDASNVVAESDETNNTAALAGGINVQRGFIDLAGQFGKMGLQANVVAGQSIRGYATVTVANNGNVAVNTPAFVDITLLAVNKTTGEQIILGTLAKRSLYKLAPNGVRPSQFKVAVNLPAGLPKGQYELRADVTPTAALPEEDLGNNQITTNAAGEPVTITAADPFVNLAPTFTKVTVPNPAMPGNRVVIVAQLVNQGNIQCKGLVNLNLQAVGDEQAIELASLNNQSVALAPGQAKMFTFSAILPAILQNGDYSLRLTVEPVDPLTEGGVFGATNNAATLLNAFAFNNPGDKEWVQQFSMSSSKESYTTTNSMALDAMGNVYVAFSGQDNFNSSTVDYLRKYDPAGRILWTRQQANYCYSASIAVDNNGNVYWGGRQTTVYGDKGLLKKYNSGGSLLWTREFENASVVRSLAVDNSGNVYVGGWAAEIITSANPKAFLVAYNPSGRKLWEQRIGTSDINYISSIAVDNNNNIYITGATGGVIKYDKEGRRLWSRGQDGKSNSVTIDMEGNVYVGGTKSWGIHQFYGYLTKYDSMGNTKWTITEDVTDRVSCGGVAVDNEGNLFFAYNTRFGSSGIYLCKYDSQGNLNWTRSIGGVGPDQYCTDMILDGSGYAYVAGTIHGTIGQESFGLYDAFLLKVDVTQSPNQSQPQPTAPDLTVHIGDPADGKPAAAGWARIDVKNEGNALAKGAVDLELWCTSDGGIDGIAGGCLLKTLAEQNLLLLPGNTQYFWANYELPEGVNPADVELIVRVDSGNVIPESDENNNYGDFNLDGNVDITDLSYLSSLWPLPAKKEWIEQITTTTNGVGQSVAVDPWNNVYFAALENRNDDPQAVLRKYDSQGNLLWSQALTDIRTGENLDNSLPLTVDSSGNVFIGGIFDNANTGSADAFVLKYDPNGTLLWGRSLETPGLDDGRSLAVDSGDNVYLAGYTEGNLFDENQGNSDAFLAKFDSDGNLVWGRQFGISYFETGTAVTVDGQDNVYLAGMVYGNLPGEGNTQDLFLTKYDSDGNLLWSRQKDIQNWDECSDIDTDDAGNVYLVGGAYSGGFDGFLTKYDTTGQHQWTEMIHSDYDYATSVEVNSGVVYVGGYTNYKLDDFHAGGFDFFISTHRTSDGEKINTRQLGTAQDDFGMGLAMDSEGFLYLGGYTEGLLGDSGTQGSNPFLAKLDADMQLDPHLSLSVADTGSLARTGTARIDFLNDGAGIGVGRVDFELWCTSDGILDGKGDYLLRTFTDETFIHGPGVTRYFWADYELPAGVNPGKVKLVAKVDTGPANGNYYGSGSIDGCIIVIAYTPSDLTTCIVDPLGGIPERTGQALLAVKNVRSENANEEGVLLELWCTSDGLIDGNENDYLLNSMTMPMSLGPRETEYYQMSYELPAGIDPADVELIAHVKENPYREDGNNFGGALAQPGYYGELLPVGLADLADFCLLGSKWGTAGSTPSGSSGDFNIDGIIDLTDLTIWVSMWGGNG